MVGIFVSSIAKLESYRKILCKSILITIDIHVHTWVAACANSYGILILSM